MAQGGRKSPRDDSRPKSGSTSVLTLETRSYDDKHELGSNMGAKIGGTDRRAWLLAWQQIRGSRGPPRFLSQALPHLDGNSPHDFLNFLNSRLSAPAGGRWLAKHRWFTRISVQADVGDHRQLSQHLKREALGRVMERCQRSKDLMRCRTRGTGEVRHIEQ